ncbi:MAG: hypothetical protein JWP12_3223 [Bacteroidetes bacterium]|nr:hypothetical protein [Bacteroidota bacterium]
MKKLLLAFATLLCTLYIRAQSDSTVIYSADSTCTYKIPNKFNPHNEKNNEMFGVTIQCMVNTGKEATFKEIQLSVTDKYGKVLFKSNDQKQKWWSGMKDGQLAETGEYVWILTYKEKQKDNWYNKKHTGIFHIVY